MQNPTISLWLHGAAQLVAQLVLMNIVPEPYAKWLQLVAAVVGAVVAWYDTNFAKSQASNQVG